MDLINKITVCLHGKKILFFAGCLLAVSSSAQNSVIDKISIASPTAASLGKYADIPVNYHTGIPSVSIPIYSVKTGSLSLPISLSYHASGLKVQEPSGWVGAGWSLNAGGVITRSVKGGPDERNTNMGATEEKGHFSNYGYNSYLSGNGQQQDWGSFAAGRKDGEPDLFFFNFAGYSGKFYFRDDRTPVLVPQQDLKIEYYFPGDTLTATGNRSDWNIQAFTITTPEGDKYYFGNSPGMSGTAPIEVTNTVTDNTGLSSTAIVSSWYLNKIASADNQFSINLTYAAEDYAYFTTGMFPVEGSPPAGSNPVYEYNLVKNIIHGVRVNQISFPGGTVDFIAGAVRTDLSSSNVTCVADAVNISATTLGSIRITNGGTFCKKFKFSYGYFSDNITSLTGYFNNSGYNSTINTDRYRLRLDTLREISCDSGIVISPHVFTYFTEPVPRLLNFGIDHWGFSNGVTTNETLIPTYTINYGSNNITTKTGANRDAAWPNMRGGALQKITYPTGGYSLFEFEPHDVYTSNSSYEPVTLRGMSMGYDGGIVPDTNTLISDGNSIKLDINNTTVYDARVVIEDFSGNMIDNIGYFSAGTNTANLTLPVGTYRVILTIASGGNPNASGGVSINFSQLVSVTHSGNTTVGGLRIKSITHNDGGVSPDMITSYSYRTAGDQSTGILYSKPVYVQALRNDLIRDLGYYTGTTFTPASEPNGCIGGAYYKSPSSIRPMGSSQGNHIGYSTVKVSRVNNGYSIYAYYPDNSGVPFSATISDVAVRTINSSFASCDPSSPNFPAAPIPFDDKRGELYYEMHYDNTGNLLKDSYYYPVFNNINDTQTPGFAIATLSIAGVTKYLGTFYSLGTVHKSSLLTIATDYNSSGSITTTSTTYYNSLYHNQPTRKITFNSTGDSMISKMQYAADFRISTCDSISTGVSSYPAACTACEATYNTSRFNSSCTGSCVSAAYITYTQCLAAARISYVALRRANFTNASNVFATNHLSAKNNADAALKPILQLQDEYNNALIEKTDWKNSNLLSALFTHYDYAASPSGFVYPQKMKTIELTSPSNTFTPAVTSTNNQSVIADSRYTDLSAFSFGGGNLASITKRDGITESYLWNYANQYPVSKTDNANETQVAHTSFESDGKGRWNYNSGSVVSNSGITGSKAYQLSGNNITSPSITSTKTYIVSYWSNAGSYSVTGTTGSVKTGRSVGSWTHFEHEITGVSQVTVSGSGSIDELRLYPKDAQMTTYTYDPLVGITSQCDINNRIQYYQYDALGRLQVIKDQDGNIIKTMQYNYKK